MADARELDFTAFYDATWRSTVACAYGMTADLTAAEDLAQEAYCRAWRRWSSLSQYDDAGAWVRLVASRLAVSRWRRARSTRDFLARSRHAEQTVAPPSEATVLLVTALRQLPEPQRRAVVLHHLGDVSVAEIARIEGCPEGTVKGRLSRGRAALAALLDAAVPEGEASHA
ncbi:MAG TPA: SigE family RNA polymerase sigma factor [Mycobacteriales bacterium]|nr:SigE family RNA polymerase sigma factor [Mycobacteriales bacterium]